MSQPFRSKNATPTQTLLIRKRLLVVDDHTLVREGIVELLRQDSSFDVCAQASNGADAMLMVQQLRPDLVVLDYFLNDGRDGPKLINEIASLSSAPRILVLSLFQQDDVAERSIRAGARGFISKHQGTEQLLRAVHTLLEGGYFIDETLRARLLDLPVANAPRPTGEFALLSDRELQVFQLLGSGLALAEIAARLGISAKTAAAHREHIKNKLNHATADAVVARAKRWLQEQGGNGSKL